MLFLIMAMLLAQENKTVFIDRVAIQVNDKIITERELLFTYKQARTEAINKYTGAELDSKLKEAWEQTVKDSEETLLMYEKAVEMGYAFSRDDILSELMSLKESKGLSDKEFEEAISAQTGMTLEELVSLRQRENSAQMVFQSMVLQRINIEDNEIAAYYNQHKNDFMTDATYRIAEIVILKAEGTSRDKAEECIKAIEAGSDFGEVAKTYSDSLSKENGGDLGLVKFGDLLGLIEDQVKNLSVGEHSPILENDAAWFIIKLLELNESRPKTLETVRDEVINALRMPRTESRLDEFLKELRAEYSLKVHTPEIPWYLEY